MKALIITRHYLDENLGGPNCSKAFIRALAAIYKDCTLIYPEHNDHATDMSFLNSRDVKLVPCFDKRSKMRKCLDMYRGRLHRFGYFVKQFTRNNTYDVVFIDHSFTASSGILDTVKSIGKKIVTLHHNVEKDYIKDNKQSILFRYPYTHYALKAEQLSIISSDLNLTLTTSDKQHFSNDYPDKNNSFEVMGMFEYKKNGNHSHDNIPENIFVISGSLASAQTEVAVKLFINEYMPVLNKVCPDNTLIITGRNPSESLSSLCSCHKNIRLIPNPENIFSAINKGRYYICPLHTGSGIKLRIMDALSLGLPVIAHKVSVRGYENIKDNGFMLGYDNISSFEHNLKKLINTGFSTNEVANCYISYFSYEAGEQRLKSILTKHHLI